MSHNKILPYFLYTKLYNLKFSYMIELAEVSYQYLNITNFVHNKMSPIYDIDTLERNEAHLSTQKN